MRGTPLGHGLHFIPFGIIPAYAGNTRVSVLRFLDVRDHPRVCGEHAILLVATCAVAGSSPRMRGTPFFHAPSFLSSGIIPAYAGNTWFARISDGDGQDHPRVCGEHMTLRLKHG